MNRFITKANNAVSQSVGRDDKADVEHVDLKENRPNTGSTSEPDGFEEVGNLNQGLHQRHIQMIALAGTIGTGLFLGCGRAIATAGPLGAWLAYSIIGIVACAVVLAVGEMGALLPLSGGYVRYSEHFLDSSISFAQGWNLVYTCAISIPAELVASAVLIQYWTEDISNAVWITVCGVAMISLALLFVRIYGEMEFTFAIVKICLVIGVNIMSLVITCGGAPNHQSIGFRYWVDPGPFVQYFGIPGSIGRFLGFWQTFSNALYAVSNLVTGLFPDSAAGIISTSHSSPTGVVYVLYSNSVIVCEYRKHNGSSC